MHFSRIYAALALYALYSQCALAGHKVVTRNDTRGFAANLLHESLDWLDRYYDNERGYLFSLDAAALTHETRASVWYAAGLLARNEVDDVEQAVRIVSNVIGAQFKNKNEQW